jgi:hypothetical protein
MRSLENLADMLEGYYRCRAPGARSSSAYGNDDCGSGYSSLGYLDYINKLGYAYATLPLRLMSQLYAAGSGARRTDACAPSRQDGLVVEPRCLTFVADAARSLHGRFSVRSACGEDVTISLRHFKDAGDAVVAGIKVYVRTDVGDWHELPKAPLKLELDECDCQSITVRVETSGHLPKGCLVGRLIVTGDSGVVTRVKLELRDRRP